MKQTFSLLAMLAFIFGVSNASAAVEVSGYGDARYSINTSVTKATGFTFSEGAIYLKAGDDKAGIMVDVPMAGGNAGSAFTVGGGRAQGYVHRKYDGGLWWRLGAFDAIWGYEAQDSIDLNYTRRGGISEFTPNNQVGLALGSSFGNIGWTLTITDNAGTGIQGGKNFDYGIKLSGGSWSLGFVWDGPSKNKLIDVTYAMDMGKMSLNLDGIVNLPDGGSTGFGVLIDLWFEGDGMDWGIRPEFSSKLVANTVFGAAVGPRFKVNDMMGIKLNYFFGSTKLVSGGTSTTTHNVDLAGEVRF
jgi:hypothetical protein